MAQVQPHTPQERRTQTLRGQVVRRSGDKTVSVAVLRVFRHPRYLKRITRTKRYLAHDEGNACQVGDTVTIAARRPLSARKRWVVIERQAAAAKAAE